jgi:quinol monooxygenase YgiN
MEQRPMHDEISWQVELTIEPQHFDSFCALTNEMIQSTTLEDGVLVYERFMSEDGAKIFVYERYANSEAALSHLRNFQKKFAEAFGRLVKRERFVVFGTPNDELKRMLSAFDATFARPMAGFLGLDKDFRNDC